jgi:polar amino acid transport system permease protein
MSGRAASRPPILDDIDRAHRWRVLRYRVIFAATWIAILLLIGAAVYSTGNRDTDWMATFGPFILGGATITVVVSALSISLAVVLALFGALGRLSSNPVINGLASFYVSLVRGTPLLVQIYFIYFSLPALGVILPAIESGVLALGFNYGAYLTEIFRAGIQAVPRGQREAAEALGMPERLVQRRIVLPQATRIVIPAIGNDFIAMIKDSALVSLIGVQELLWRAETTGRPARNTLEAFVIIAVIYWMLTIIFSFFQERLERRMAKGDR